MKSVNEERPYHIFTLDNGLRVIHTPSPTSVAYCGYAINAGTRDEAAHEQGIAHFVEHLLFKGTTKRKAWHILNRMENVGGDLNAYTNKEETVIYSAFLQEHFGRAVELLTDIVFRSTFPASEITKEVEVIIDEIQSYEDSPAELIFDDFEELIYPHHPLGRNILGKPDLLRKFRSEDAQAFTRRHYRTDNMVFFVWANIPTTQVRRTLERHLDNLPQQSATDVRRSSPPPYEPHNLTLGKDTTQAHIMMGGRAYSAHDTRRTGLYLLNNILGGPGMNSRLNLALRERRGLVYNVESHLTSYTDAGTFCIYFGCDHADAERCLDIARKELNTLRLKKLSDAQLQAAKKQIIGQISVASDNFENAALGMGKSFLHYGRMEARQEVFKRIESLTALHLQEIADEMFHEAHLSVLRYG